MEANVGVRVIPMAAGPMPPVDERDGRLRFGQEGVGESHSHRARAHDASCPSNPRISRPSPVLEWHPVRAGLCTPRPVHTSLLPPYQIDNLVKTMPGWLRCHSGKLGRLVTAWWITKFVLAPGWEAGQP